MTYNVGGFAKWAQLISGMNFTCNVRHWTKGVDKKSADKSGCRWIYGKPSAPKRPKIDTPLFLPPINR